MEYCKVRRLYTLFAFVMAQIRLYQHHVMWLLWRSLHSRLPQSSLISGRPNGPTFSIIRIALWTKGLCYKILSTREEKTKKRKHYCYKIYFLVNLWCCIQYTLGTLFWFDLIGEIPCPPNEVKASNATAAILWLSTSS